MEIKLTDNESLDIFFDALCDVYGNNYWGEYGLSLTADKEAYQKAKKLLKKESEKSDKATVEEIFMMVLANKEALQCIDHDTGEYTRSIYLKDIIERVPNVKPPSRLVEAFEGTGDIETSDIILQHVFFEEIVFG